MCGPPKRRMYPMRNLTTLLATASLLVVIGRTLADAENSGLNNDGFITTWLLLAPIPLADGDSGSDAMAKEQLKEEGKVQPLVGDKVKAGSKELVWKNYR